MKRSEEVCRVGYWIGYLALAAMLLVMAMPATPAYAAAVEVPVIGQVVGQPVARITASTAVVLRSTGSQGTLTWITVPEAASEHLTKIQMGSGERGVMFSWPGHPEVTVILIATDGLTTTTKQFTIPADGGPAPDPFPQPEPQPQPEPSPTPAIEEVVIIRETAMRIPGDAEEAKRKAKQAAIILDKGWRKILSDRNPPVEIQVLDRDRLPARLQSLKEKASDGPIVCFLATGGDVSEVVPLPDSIEGLSNLVKEKTQ